MHDEANKFVASVKEQMPEFFTGKKVLEVGSLDINGSVRRYFDDCAYIGIDLGPGRGVDIVCHVSEFNTAPPLFDVVISAEALEHDAKWSVSLRRMYDLLKPNGILVLTCAAPNRPEHGTIRSNNAEASPFTTDYYRNISTEDFVSVLPANLFSKSYLGYRGNKEDLYFAGIKVDGLSRDLIGKQRSLTVTAEVATKDRLTTTLPMCISAILNQTRKPERLVIYNDGEQKSLEEVEPIKSLLRMAIDHLGIQWTVYATPQQGQVTCHQHALDDAQTDCIWRVDDDEIPEPNCLENLLAEMKDGVGAVGGLVHHPGNVVPLPDSVQGKIEDITRGTNISWFSWNGGPREVEHLYSSFLLDVAAMKKAGGYPSELSVVGHREESWATIRLHQAGFKLITTPRARTWHLQEKTGGIRSYSDGSLWQHDEALFQEYLKTIGQTVENEHLVILDSGIGDHCLFAGLLRDEFMRKYPDRKWLLAVCYPEVFENIPNVRLISIAEAKLIVGDRYQSYSLFEYGWHHGNGRHILDVMREFFTKDLEQ